ncbi:Nif3-like dinuclear metal center hexameric protein [Crocinitomix algicola]|uniref:Nif3-like dinuclear metal center hexameric protein n=1 Tax=Crocinitomix algicola TaxID=1740263 RepID=UPI0008732C4B|nr:Nif3-like dinuclear metal center hexameric protein [Crocinitomix algicola]
MKIVEITKYLESLAPLSSQESYDNSGLIVGNPHNECTNVLISLDCTEDIVEEAIKKNCNLIISHHPIVFKGLKKLNGKNYVERTVIKAIKNEIALYAIHTNLDNYQFGVNYKIGQALGINNPRILAPTNGNLKKLSVFCPKSSSHQVKSALFEAGAGHIGNYSECSFESEGIGSFKPSEIADPFVGTIGERHNEDEVKIEVLINGHLQNSVVNSLLNAHPYEEVAFDIYPIDNKNYYEGAGMIGELNEEMDEAAFLKQVKQVFNCQIIRHTKFLNKPIKRVAWCGGAGSFLLPAAKSQMADIYITGDFKYHEFFDAESDLVIADIGHFESEQYTIELIDELLRKKFRTFAPCLTEINTNPVKYF